MTAPRCRAHPPADPFVNKQHTLSVLVENEFGVLARVAGLFSGRGYNIESLCVAANPLDPSLSRITLVTVGDDQVLEQVVKQLNKVVSVVQVTDFQDVATVSRELALIKVTADEKTRAEVMNVVDIFRAKIVDVGSKAYVIEVTGTEDKIQAMIELLQPIGIQEVVRTGRVTIARGNQSPARAPRGAKEKVA
jgi:acetolactate synthase I/III small subunit